MGVIGTGIWSIGTFLTALYGQSTQGGAGFIAGILVGGMFFGIIALFVTIIEDDGMDGKKAEKVRE